MSLWGCDCPLLFRSFTSLSLTYNGLICSFNKYLLNDTCVPGTELGPQNTGVNKTEALPLWEAGSKKVNKFTRDNIREWWLLLLLLSHFSRVRLVATPWTAAHQAPPSMGFSRQEYWSGVPSPSPYNHLLRGKRLDLVTSQWAVKLYDSMISPSSQCDIV